MEQKQVNNVNNVKPKQNLGNAVLIGGKPIMNYVTAVITQFSGGQKEVIVKSRGKFISRAVDTAEIVTKRFMKDLVKIEKITTNSEEFINSEKRNVRVSGIEIVLQTINK